MNYKLKFLPAALKEWEKLSSSIKAQLKKKLAERLLTPHVPSCRLRGYKNCYKIKLKSANYRLIYEVSEQNICIMGLYKTGFRQQNPPRKLENYFLLADGA